MKPVALGLALLIGLNAPGVALAQRGGERGGGGGGGARPAPAARPAAGGGNGGGFSFPRDNPATRPAPPARPNPPNGGNVGGRPPSGGNVGRPPSGGNAGRPPGGGNVGRPPSGGNVGRPPSGGNTGRPPSVSPPITRPPAGRPPSGRPPGGPNYGRPPSGRPPTIIVRPNYRPGPAWGWNHGVVWAPVENYWGGGFWGSLAIGAISAAVYGSIVSANQTYTSYQVQPYSPGATLLQNYQLQQVPCGPPGLVQIFGPDNSVICAAPNNIVAPGDYDLDASQLSLISQ